MSPMVMEKTNCRDERLLKKDMKIPERVWERERDVLIFSGEIAAINYPNVKLVSQLLKKKKKNFLYGSFLICLLNIFKTRSVKTKIVNVRTLVQCANRNFFSKVGS